MTRPERRRGASRERKGGEKRLCFGGNKVCPGSERLGGPSGDAPRLRVYQLESSGGIAYEKRLEWEESV